MKKNMSIWLAIAIGLVLLLSACGEKSQEDVMGKLSDNLEDMKGYKATAEMKMDTGNENEVFNIDILHKKDDLYRVQLTTDKKDKESQVILKNKEGVFVLTPALNKSFKFQSEWPENGSQPYLYQSLLNDIEKDEDAVFSSTEEYYVFQTKTNYQSNNNLPYQEIYFDKNTYTPVHVKVLDKDKKAVVEVKFTSFEMDPEFKKDAFEIEKNMTSSTSTDVPVTTDSTNSFSVMFPLNTAGAVLAEQIETDLEDGGTRVIMTFEGEKDFTLVEEQINVEQTLASPQMVDGEIVNLGFAVGAISENSIEWHVNGTDFLLASDELTREELIEVATSVQGQEIK
ncbi:LolA family protein [Virgibacillus sp. DJP39]|uniref:LolA family protein n=1 Tax=Virgibacillus sp. DJP39 TaxID=3409790 RepID=UPI003BB6FA8A